MASENLKKQYDILHHMKRYTNPMRKKIKFSLLEIHSKIPHCWFYNIVEFNFSHF